ncbi:MAG: hypothetical protein ORO02_08780 [Bacteroidia bacterium]|nr:hypothetical protein [Bacteroidia bacterium]
MNMNKKKHWALSSLALCMGGLGAQWDGVATKVASDTAAVVTTVGDSETEIAPKIYQGRVLSSLDNKKIVLASTCGATESNEPIEMKELESLIHSGDLQQFGAAYINFHPIQVGLLNEYLKHPDLRHKEYVKMSFDEDIGNPFIQVMDAIDNRRKVDSMAFANFSFVSSELYGKAGGSYLEYSDREYEYALAAYVNALFPADTTLGLGGAEQNDENIPARIRSQVEGIRSLVSVGLWRLWQEQNEIQVPGDDEDETESLDVDPAFSAVESITVLRDSLWAISGELEQYILPENRDAFQALKPWLKPIPRDSVNDRVLVGETFFEQWQKRANLVDQLKNEKRRVLVLGSDPIEQFAVHRYSAKVLPSLMEDLLMDGVKLEEIGRVFMLGMSSYEHTLMRLKQDSSATTSAMDTTVYPPLSALGGTDTAALGDDPFGMGKQDTVKLFTNVTDKYLLKDSVQIETLVLQKAETTEGWDWGVAVDSASVAYEGWDDEESSSSSFMSKRIYGSVREDVALVFDVAYTQIKPIFKPKYLNAMRSVMGLPAGEELNLITQGISIGINTRKGNLLQNHRLQLAQTVGGEKDNYGATYVLYSDMTQFPLGRFLTFGVGGFTGYGEQRYKKFMVNSGGFINQEQPSFVVSNPAYLYGLTIEPTVHVGPFFARVTGGYAWDLGESTWLYQKEPMNNGSEFKSTGWYLMGEVGLHWKFDDNLYSGGSRSESYSYDTAATVSVGQKSPRTKERRTQK